MRYTTTLNLLLEALAYLGSKANGYTFAWMEERLKAKGIQDMSALRQNFAPVNELIRRLDNQCPICEETLGRLFQDLDGFPFNTTGLYSPAFLLFYPVLERYQDDLDAVLDYLESLSLDHTGRHILLSLNLGDNIGTSIDGCADLFINTVLSLTIPPESRLALLELHRGSRALIREIGACLRPVIQVLERCRDELQVLADQFGQELKALGCENFLRKTTSLVIAENMHYDLRPFIFGLDTNLALEQYADAKEVVVHCAVMINHLHQIFSSAKAPEVRVYDAIHLLGDRTRFDILCFLRDHPAYGSEISERLGLARNTIYHHMSKLLNADLVSCSVDGNRVCYVTNKERMSKLLSQMHCLLVGDPEQ